MNQDKQDYREYCSRNDSVPLFNKDWWLDQVCGENNWGVSLVRQNNEIVASHPYYLRKNFLGLDYISTPPLTPYMGPYITYPNNQKLSNRLDYEDKVIHELISHFPRFSYFYQRFHYSVTNWKPLYWEGFQQTTHYTQVIEDLTDIDSVFSSFDRTKKANIRAGEEALTVEASNDLDEFYRLNTLTFRKQGLSPNYSLDYIKKIDAACVERDCRRILFAKDESGQIHCGTYLVWDKASSYCLMSGLDPSFKTSRSHPLLIWEQIKFSSKVTKRFDFAGSMIIGIDKFERGFGGIQLPYSIITKNFGSPLMDQMNNLLTQFPYFPNTNFNFNSMASRIINKISKKI